MKILFISHSSPLKEGGAETRTREVAFRLARSGHSVTILCGKTDADDPGVAEVNGVTIISKKILPDRVLRRYPYPHYVSLAAANLFLMFYIPPLLKHRDFDLIREDMAPFPPSFLLSLVRLPVSKRIVVVHMLSKSFSGWVKYYGAVFGCAGFVMDRLLRGGLLKYDRIVSASEWNADELREHRHISGKVSFVPNGVNFSEFGDRGERRNANGEKRLLSVGRLVETKGQRFAIEALFHLRDRFPETRLDILGDGPLKEPLMKLARTLKVADRVTFLAPVSHERMPDILRSYDFLVLPSIWEGLPVSVVEAMASRLPIVSTEIPAITSILDANSATLAQPGDAADLAEKLRWAFEHPDDVRKQSDRAYEIAKMYDWATTASQEIEEPSTQAGAR
jgi:glycosyltransferase involved in cell wall biosynthesis